nr:hypothetical protein [Pseudomonadota bacterium]
MKYLISGKVTAINNVYLHINLYNLSVGALIFDESNEVLGEILSSNNIETIAVSFTRKVYIDSVIYTYNNPYSYYLSPDKIGSITDIYGKSLYNHSFRRKLNIQDIELTLSQNRNTIVGRKQIRHQLMTGIRSIDLLYPLGVGQRIAVVAPAGIGKSTLIKQIAKNTFSDINVIALVGERGREVSELINSNNFDCLSKSIVIYATSDSPPLERINCLEIALCISEYLRDEGLNVLFLVDSFTRYLRAHKEQALFLQEPPIYKSFPNSTITQIAKILERASNSDKGTISTIITLLQESEDDEDPLINEVISVVDGHLFLCKETQYKNIY